MSKWVDAKTGEAMADTEERKGGYVVPMICSNCGGLKCAECDNDGVIMVEAKNISEIKHAGKYRMWRRK